MADTPSKLQRWLDLVAFLAGHHFPVTQEQIWTAVPAYAGGLEGGDKDPESVRRMFMRDKDELGAMGIPIETVTFEIEQGSERSHGYRLADRRFHLPYLRLVRAAEVEARGGTAARASSSVRELVVDRGRGRRRPRGAARRSRRAGLSPRPRGALRLPQAGLRPRAGPPRADAGAPRRGPGDGSRRRHAPPAVRRPDGPQAGRVPLPVDGARRGGRAHGAAVGAPLSSTAAGTWWRGPRTARSRACSAWAASPSCR